MKLKKLFSITTVPLLLSGLFLAPVSANPIQGLPEYKLAQNIMPQGITKFARISEIYGSTVTVVFRDGSSQDIQVSSGDMSSMNLMANNYVVIAGNNIVNVVQIGEITNISGSTVTVAFDNQTSNQYQVSSGDFQALSLQDGLSVGVVNNQIVGVTSVGKIVSIVGDIASVRMFNGELVTIGVSRRHKIDAMDVIAGELVYVANDQIVAVADSLSEVRMAAVTTNNTDFQEQENVQASSESRRVVQTQVTTMQPVAPMQSVAPMPTPVEEPVQPTQPVRGLW